MSNRKKSRAVEPKPEAEAAKPNPYCQTCGTRLAPEEGDPFKGSALLYDNDDFANLMGALFLSGWCYEVLQRTADDGRPRVVVIGTPVDAGGNRRDNRRTLSATFEHIPGTGWACMAEMTGYFHQTTGALQNRTPDQLVTYIGNNTAEWVLAPIDEPEPEPEQKPKRKRGKTISEPEPEPETTVNGEDQAQPVIDPESKGLPAGSTPPETEPAPETEAEPETEPEPQPEPEPEAADPEVTAEDEAEVDSEIQDPDLLGEEVIEEAPETVMA
ncbi:hypothetical protein [Nocardia terpenica]|uniref:Uncharacterized protein n=1 Tax=Nocardia terpenica TaxID=455432 RepID=A0A164H2N5_9NOCA|nr:hypothetical protein [Nocardia terpenica]KZM68147.1 hypothetical protein AWN90_09405 [Nocardia terpenica]